MLTPCSRFRDSLAELSERIPLIRPPIESSISEVAGPGSSRRELFKVVAYTEMSSARVALTLLDSPLKYFCTLQEKLKESIDLNGQAD